MAGKRILTVGHSNHDTARFLELLHQAGVTAIADVRSQPYSKWLPQFNRPELQELLRDGDIAYVFLGEQLGGRPRDVGLYNADGRVNYERVRQTKNFQQGIERVCGAMEDYAIALLCSEEDPLDCHRGLMIAPALVERGLAPGHLRGDGSIESTQQFEDRLLAETKVGVGLLDGLFAESLSTEDREALLREAYRLQARKKSFRVTDGDANERDYTGD